MLNPFAYCRLCRQSRGAERAYVSQCVHLPVSCRRTYGSTRFQGDQLGRMQLSRRPPSSPHPPPPSLSRHLFNSAPHRAVFSVNPPRTPPHFTKIVQRRRASRSHASNLPRVKPGCRAIATIDTRSHPVAVHERVGSDNCSKPRPVHRDVLRRLHGPVGHSDRSVVTAKYRWRLSARRTDRWFRPLISSPKSSSFHCPG